MQVICFIPHMRGQEAPRRKGNLNFIQNFWRLCAPLRLCENSLLVFETFLETS
jgi:hypothetical protein